MLLLFFLSLLGIVAANTESILINVPKDFNSLATNNGMDQNGIRTLNMGNKLVRKHTVPLRIDSATSYQVMELYNVQPRKDYQIKVCWSAIEGYDIRDLGYILVDAGSEIVLPGNHSSLGAAESDSIYLYFRVYQDTYPRIPDGYETEVNISMVNLVAYVPIDCIPMVLFLILAILPILYILKKDMHMLLLQ